MGSMWEHGQAQHTWKRVRWQLHCFCNYGSVGILARNKTKRYCGRSHSPYILLGSYCGDKKLGKTEPAKTSRKGAVRGIKSKGLERIPVASSALVYQPDRDCGLSTLPITALWAEQHPKLLHLGFQNCPILLKCTITCSSQLLGLLRRSK